MSWWNNGAASGSGATGAHHDLRLQLAPPAERMEVVVGDGNNSSPSSSCVSSDSSPRERTQMLIGGCSRCILYCMVSVKEFPICVNCKQPNLIDVLHSPALAAQKHDQVK